MADTIAPCPRGTLSAGYLTKGIRLATRTSSDRSRSPSSTRTTIRSSNTSILDASARPTSLPQPSSRLRLSSRPKAMSTQLIASIRTDLQTALSAYSVSVFPAAHFKRNTTLTVTGAGVDGALLLVSPSYRVDTWETSSGTAAAAAARPKSVREDGAVFLIVHVLPDGSWEPYVPASTARYASGATVNVTWSDNRFVVETDGEEPVAWTILPL